MPTDFADTVIDRTEREHDDDIEFDTRRVYTPVVGYSEPGVYASTLDSLFRQGNLLVTDNGHIICIDLTIRRSGLTLYGTGHSMLEAIDDINDQLIDHIDALNHLENLGLDVTRLDEIVGDDYGEFDPGLLDVYAEYDKTDSPESAAPILANGLGEFDRDPILPEQFAADDEDEAPIPFVIPTADAMPLVAAAGEPIDGTSPGYILALLIPVRPGRA